jgi:hypothetical protein
MHTVLEYLREEGFLFVSLDAEDAQVVKDFKKSAMNYLAGLEDRSAAHRKKLQYSNKAGSRSPVGYAEMDELHGYLVRPCAIITTHAAFGHQVSPLSRACMGTQTRKHKKKTFPWPKASKKEKELGKRYWKIITRAVVGLLKNVADSLGVPHELLLSLLQSDPSQEEAWLMERIQARRSSNPDLANRPASPKVLLSVGKTHGIRTTPNTPDDWNHPVIKMFHFREVLSTALPSLLLCWIVILPSR